MKVDIMNLSCDEEPDYEQLYVKDMTIAQISNKFATLEKLLEEAYSIGWEDAKYGRRPMPDLATSLLYEEDDEE